MLVNGLELLGYTHDATLLNVTYGQGKDGLRILKMKLRFNHECGHEDWGGKEVQFTFIDVLLFGGYLLGYSTDLEEVNSIYTRLPSDSRSIVSKLVSQGISQPNVELTVVLQSGSEICLACHSVEAIAV